MIIFFKKAKDFFSLFLKQFLFIILIHTVFMQSSFAAREKNLPLPRFASLRSNNINVHVGPGKQYPIEWKYQRQFLPIEIIAEFDTWRQIKDIDGCVSWIHMSLLSGKRHAIIVHDIQNLKAKPSDDSATVARLEPSCIVALKKIQGIWVFVESRSEKGKYSGWLKNNQIWGIYPYETSFK
ncbi:MAG: hypothetical protein KBD31_02785 [Proteobacteria bacterium]|nr:hypothetical protein [Pseudomonadota bacterium]